MLKRETINQDYEALYCLVPREQLPPKEDLLTAVDRLKTNSENDYFNTHAAQVVLAACQRQDFIASNVFHKTCIEIYKQRPELKAELFALLSAVCLTNSVPKIHPELRPEELVTKYSDPKTEVSEKELQAFIKFANNFIIELPGMRDLREEPTRYIAFVKRLIEDQNKDIRLNGYRYLMNMCRALTARQITDSFIAFVFDKLTTLLAQQNDEKVAFNLCCGAVGRICITLQLEEPSKGQQVKQQLKKILSTTPVQVKVPCGEALQKFAQPARLPTAEDEMF